MLQVRSSPSTRMLHVTAAVAAFGFVTWGLLSSNPLDAVRNTPLEVVRKLNDILIHFSVYVVLTLTCVSVFRQGYESRYRIAILAILVTHAIGTEILQSMIPRRSGDPVDAAANIMGISIGSLLAARISRRMMQRTTAG